MLILCGLLLVGGLLVVASLAVAQRPGGPREGPAESADEFVARMMAFDKDRDGKLTKAEVTDERLHRLLDRADADHDGTATKEELTALFAREAPAAGGPRGGFGPPGGGGPGGRGPGRFGGPPQPGQVLPSALQDRLALTDEQRKQVADLQKDVDAKLEKILTSAQKGRLREMRERGPGGFGPPPGRPGGAPRPPEEPR